MNFIIKIFGFIWNMMFINLDATFEDYEISEPKDQIKANSKIIQFRTKEEQIYI